MNQSSNRLKVLVIILSVVVKFLGFSRDLVLAHFYGASNITDAYLVATTLPITLFSFVGVAISSTFIPISAEIGNLERKNKFTTGVLISIVSLSLLFITTVNLFPSYIVKILAFGFDVETTEIAISMLRVSIINVFFSGLIFLSVAYLNSNKRFIVPLIRSIPFDLFVIGSIVISYYTSNTIVLTLGIVLSVLIEFLFIFPFAFKNGFKFSRPNKESWKYTKTMIILSIPAILSSTVGELNGLIDRSIASTVGYGSISSLTYSGRIIAAFIGIFVTSLITIYYPRLSETFLEDKKKYFETIKKVSYEVLFLTTPLCFGSIVLGRVLIKLLYGWGNVDSNSLLDISNTFFMYSISIVFWGMRDLLNTVFYSQKRTIFPCVVTLVSLSLNIGLNFALIKPLGLQGLALATSISIIVNFVILFSKLIYEKSIFVKKTLIETSKIILAGLIMAVSLFFGIKLLSGHLNNIAIFIIGLLVGSLIYLGLCILFKSDVVVFIINKFKRIGGVDGKV